MFDLNVKWKATKPKENTEFVKQLLKLGWSTTAWTTSNFGKLGAKAQKLSSTLALDAADVRDCLKHRGVVAKDELADVRQLSRITVTIDEVTDAQALTAGNETLKAFDVVAACPGNAAVFAYLCKTAQVDIISIDFRRKVSFPMIKKLLDQAVERGIHFEILYGPLLNDPNSRKEVLAGTRVLVQFLRGRHIILSSGAESPADIRGPFDVINMGQMLNMTAEQARMAITKNCEAVIQHAMARRLRFIPAEVLPREEALARWAKKSAGAASRSKPGAEPVESTAVGEKRACAEKDEESGEEDSDSASGHGGEVKRARVHEKDTEEVDADSGSDEDGKKEVQEDEDDGYLKF